MYRSALVLFLFLFCTISYRLFGQDTTGAYRLKVADLNVGFDTRFLHTLQDSASAAYYTTITQGISFRYQSSIILQALTKYPGKPFKIGDLLSGEMTAGLMQSNDPEQKIPLWFAYRFEMGMVMQYRFSQKVELGMNLILLRFSRDYVTQNISGSALDLRLRLERVILEGGMDNRVLRIFGYVANADDEANMGHLGFRYLLSPGRNVGARLEWLSKSRSANGDGLLNVRVYWGKSF